MLRECVSFYDPYERKQVIEKVYSWYREKRKLLLDYRLRKHRREAQQLKRQSANVEAVNNVYDQAQHQEVHVSQTDDNSWESADNKEDDYEFITERIEPIRSDKKVTIEDLKDQVKKRLASEQDVLPDPQDYEQKQLSHFDPRVRQFDVLSEAANDSSIPFYLSEDKKRKVFVNNKLKQYSRRNMAKSEAIRKNIAQSVTKGLSASPVSQLENPYDSTSIRKFRNTTQEKKKRLADLYTYSERSNEEKDEHIMKHWLSHRASDAEEQLEQIEFRDAVVSWSTNRARMEEEIHRRHESLMFSSQTGLRVHKIVRKTDLEVEKERRLMNTSLKKRTLVNFLDSSSDEEEENESEKNFSSKIQISQKQDQPKTPDLHENQQSIFLSPYNNLEEIGLEGEREAVDIPALNTLQDPEAFGKGFLTPSTHVNIPTTSSQRFFLTELPSARGVPSNHRVAASLDSARLSIRTPASRSIKKTGDFNAVIRPSSTSIVHRNTKASKVIAPLPPPVTSRKDKDEPKLPEPPPITYNITKPNFGKYLSDDKVIAHNVFEHYVSQVTKHNENVVKAMKSTKKGAVPAPPPKQKPSSRSVSPSSSRPSSSNRNLSRPAVPAQQQEIPKAEPQIMSFDDLGQPPSLLHSTQVDECERIKLCLAKKRINIPSSVLERSIIIPEDQPYQKCITSLPLPSVYLIDDVSLTTRKPKRPKSSSRNNARTPRSIPSSRPGSSGNTSRPGTSRPSSSGNTSRPNSGRIR